MNNLNRLDYENILNFSNYLHKDNFRKKVLEGLQNFFNLNYTVFFLADSKNYQLKNPITLTVNKKLIDMYKEYYFQTDIFYPPSLPNYINQKNIISITDIMTFSSFEKTEYYNDFLRREDFYFQISMPLMFNNEFIGGIGILKERKEGNFSQKEILILKKLNRIISKNLNDYLEIISIKKRKTILENFFTKLPVGVLILNDNYSLIDFNESASKYCLKISKSKSPFTSIQNVIDIILNKCTLNKAKENTYFNTSYKKYRFKIFPVVAQNNANEMKTYYLIYIYKQSNNKTNLIENLRCKYNLTNRETDIINNILKGKRNREIAEELHISIHTVKSHIEHIYTKLEINTRTEIFPKLFCIE